MDGYPRKYQKTFCKVAPQPYAAFAPSPNSTFKPKLTFPEQLKLTLEKQFIIYRQNQQSMDCYQKSMCSEQVQHFQLVRLKL